MTREECMAQHPANGLRNDIEDLKARNRAQFLPRYRRLLLDVIYERSRAGAKGDWETFRALTAESSMVSSVIAEVAR